MCGIAGFSAQEQGRNEIAESLLDSLSSRGPDRRAHADRGGYCLVQTRLAVVDLSDRVVYPMPNETRNLWLLFNGEIYDHRLLRVELERLGHRFATDCDAEVVIHGYEEWGTSVFGRLNGMFAVALVDERRDEIVLARDRVGIKPLARLVGGRFAFASDAMALVSAGLSAGEPDDDAIGEFAAFQYVPHPRTGISDIAQVEPGTALTRTADGFEYLERWAPAPFEGEPDRAEVPASELEGALRRAVSRQLEADVGVGIFLSSGVDSALLATLAAGAGAQPEAFTIGFSGYGDYDEVGGAARLALALAVPHHHENLSVGFVEALDGVAAAYDQPFADPSAIPTLALAKLASPQVTVALSGTGGDDCFAGYYRHRAHRFDRLLDAVPNGVVERLARRSIDRGAERRNGVTLARSYAIRLARAAAREGDDRYLSLVGESMSAAGLDAVSVSQSAHRARAGVAGRLGGVGLGSGGGLRTIQRFEFASYVPGDLLTKEDRATMAFGLEARVPLLDNEVLALAERMPDRQKASLRRGKLPLRQVASRIVPPGHITSRKRGFAVPLRELLAGSWREEAVDWFRASESQLVEGEAAAGLLSAEPSAAPDVWALGVLLSWERRLRECRAQGRSLGRARRVGAVPPSE